MLILVLGSIWMGQSAKKGSQQAVSTISHLYLDELAGRREQVVADNLQKRVSDMQTALDLMTEEDLSNVEHLQNYQAKMKQYFNLKRFAFVDEEEMSTLLSAFSTIPVIMTLISFRSAMLTYP